MKALSLEMGYGLTPLSFAVYLRKAEIVDLLLAHKDIQVNKANPSDGKTALWWAAHLGYLEIVEALLRKTDIDLDLASNDGTTPLSAAAASQHMEVVEALLNAGADVNK